MFALNLSLLGHNTDVHFRVPRDKRKKICQHLGGKPLKFAGLPNHVRVSINYDFMHIDSQHKATQMLRGELNTRSLGKTYQVQMSGTRSK